MNKLFLKYLELKGYKQADFEGMEAEKQAEIERDYLSHLEEKMENLATNESVKEQIKGLATSEQIKTLEKMINELKDANVFGNVVKTFDQELTEKIEENITEIQKAFEAKSGVVKFTIKAPATITTASGTNTAPPALTGQQLAPLSPVNLRAMQILGLTNQLSTSEASYPYTETVPKDGDYAFVAEGTLKPQIDFTWDTKYASPKTIAAWQKLTRQAVYDVKGLQSIATDYLRKKHDLKKSKMILLGDGVGENPKGATTYGRAFSAGALALQVTNPNFLDTINAGVTDIYTTHNYEDETPYMASLTMINPVDFFINLVSAKTADGVPLYPTASLFNQVVIGGNLIIPEESIPTGKVFIADMSKYNTTDYEGYNVTIGWVNDDFIKNQFVILGESRMHAFVKKLDEQAFIYDDIATIKTAITKP